MKVICLKRNSMKYTCNAYLILGSWNSLQDTNTLIDVGIDASIINEIEKINTGVGKRPVEQIIITHEHFDHAGGVKEVKSWCNAKIYAYKKFPGVDELLRDGQVLQNWRPRVRSNSYARSLQRLYLSLLQGRRNSFLR